MLGSITERVGRLVKWANGWISEQVAPPLPRDISDVDRKREYVSRLQGLQAQSAALETGMIGALETTMNEIADSVAGVIQKEYQLEAAARNMAATISNLENLSDAEIKRIWGDFSRQFAEKLKEAETLGFETIDTLLATVGEEALAASGLTSKSLLQEMKVMSKVSADLIKEVSAEIIMQVNTQIALGVSGAISPTKLIQNIQAFVPVGTTRWANVTRGHLLRAEAIVRTELGRIYSIAQDLRDQQYAAEGIETIRIWNHSNAEKPHPGHPELHGVPRDEKTGLYTNEITGATLRYPRDPLAPASETVNCGCYETITTKRFKDKVQ